MLTNNNSTPLFLIKKTKEQKLASILHYEVQQKFEENCLKSCYSLAAFFKLVPHCQTPGQQYK